MSNASKVVAPEISFGVSGRKDMIFQLPLTASELLPGELEAQNSLLARQSCY